MVIKSSSRQAVRTLIADLASDRTVARDAAVARLTVIGARAVAPLTAIVQDRGAAVAARVAALKAVEAIADPRSLRAVVAALDDDAPAVAEAAARAARAFVAGPAGLPAIDRLTALLLDRSRPEALRAAAARTLAEIDADSLGPVREVLDREPNGRLADLLRRPVPAASGAEDGADSGDAAGILRLAAGGTPADDPSELTRALGRAPDGIPLHVLKEVVDVARDRERGDGLAAASKWRLVRGAAHAALARRGSRLALYDLREAFERAERALPPDFVTALTAIGDRSCLEPLAAGFVRAAAAGTDGLAWSRRLAELFSAVAARERVTARHAVARRIARRWPGTLRQLWPARRQ